MEYTSPSAVGRRTRKGRQKASTPNNNCGKPMIKVSTKEYFLDHKPPTKRRTRRGRTSDNTDNFSMNISKRNIPRSSRVLRSATQTHHEAEILSESQSSPHPCLADHQDPLTDPLHFEIGGDISSSEESPIESSKASSRLLIKRVGSDHKSINAGPPKGCYTKCKPDFNDLSMENNNLTSQPNNNATADGQQRASCNELIVEPHQRALDAEEIYRTDDLTSVSKAINPETQSQDDATHDSDFDHLLSDGSTFFEDYRWLLGLDTNDLAPVLPEVSIDDIATLPNLDLDESVPVTEIRPTLFQDYANGIDSDLTAGPTSYQWDGGSQVLDSVATRAAALPMIPQHEPSCVSTPPISSPLNVNTNFRTVPQSRSFDTTIKKSGRPSVSGGTIERISSAVKLSQLSILDNNPNSPYIKQEPDFEPQCRIHLVDTPPSFTRISEPDVTPIRHQVFERQNSVHSDERLMRNLRDRQQEVAARPQRTSAAQQNELQHLVHSVGPQINTSNDRQRESFARRQITDGAQVSERQNSVHSDGPPMDIRQNVINSQPFMRTPPAGAATYRPQPSECQYLVHSEEPRTVTSQNREQQSFTRQHSTSGAQPGERQDAKNSLSYQAESFLREQPFMPTPMPTTATYRPQSNKRQRSVHPDEPPMRIFRSRQQQSVTGPHSSSGAQANELQNSVHSREPPRRTFQYGAQRTTGAQPNVHQNSIHFDESPLTTFQGRQEESFARPQRTSGAQPNERQNSIHFDESPLTTFQGRQEESFARPQQTSGAQPNERQNSIHFDESPLTTFRGRQEESFARPQRTSGAQPNERQNSIHFDESPLTTFQGRQQLLARPRRTSRPHANETFRSDQPCISTRCNPQANEGQNLVHSGSPVVRIYPRPFARIPSTVATPITPRVIERQNWHHSYQPQLETHNSRQDEPSSSTMALLPDVIEVGRNFTSPKQYQHKLRTVRRRSQQTRAQMEASARDISNQQYGSAALDSDSNQYLRPHSVRNIPSSSGARNKIINPEPIRESSGEQEHFNSFARSGVSSMMGMYAEYRQNCFSPSHSLTDNYANTPQGSADHSSPDAQFGSWRDSLNVLSDYGY